jgi:hypothetical protein
MQTANGPHVACPTKVIMPITQYVAPTQGVLHHAMWCVCLWQQGGSSRVPHFRPSANLPFSLGVCSVCTVTPHQFADAGPPSAVVLLAAWNEHMHGHLTWLGGGGNVQARSQLVLFSTSDIASLLESLARLEFRPRKRFRENVLEELLRWGRNGMHPRDTGRIIRAAAALKMPVSFKFMQKMLHGARDRLGELPTPELVGLLVSVVSLDRSRPSEEWLRGFEAVVEVRVPELSARQAGELAWALCRLNWVPKDMLVEGLLARVAEGVDAGAWAGHAEELTKVAEACGFWKVAVPAAVAELCDAASDQSVAVL